MLHMSIMKINTGRLSACAERMKEVVYMSVIGIETTTYREVDDRIVESVILGLKMFFKGSFGDQEAKSLVEHNEVTFSHRHNGVQGQTTIGLVGCKPVRSGFTVQAAGRC